MSRTRPVVIGAMVIVGLGVAGWLLLKEQRLAPLPPGPVFESPGDRPVQLPRAEDLGRVLPPEPTAPTAVTASPRQASTPPTLAREEPTRSAPRSGSPGGGLTPPPEALERLERDGAVIY